MSGGWASKVCVATGAGGSVRRATALTSAREAASVVGCDVRATKGAAMVGRRHA